MKSLLWLFIQHLIEACNSSILEDRHGDLIEHLTSYKRTAILVGLISQAYAFRITHLNKPHFMYRRIVFVGRSPSTMLWNERIQWCGKKTAQHLHCAWEYGEIALLSFYEQVVHCILN